MDLTNRLRNCVAQSQQKEKLEEFRSVLDDILSGTTNNPDLLLGNLKEYVNHILDEQVGLVVARQLLSEFIDLFDEHITDLEVKKQLLSFAIERAQPRAVSFEEQVCNNDNSNKPSFLSLMSPPPRFFSYPNFA